MNNQNNNNQNQNRNQNNNSKNNQNKNENRNQSKNENKNSVYYKICKFSNKTRSSHGTMQNILYKFYHNPCHWAKCQGHNKGRQF